MLASKYCRLLRYTKYVYNQKWFNLDADASTEYACWSNWTPWLIGVGGCETRMFIQRKEPADANITHEPYLRGVKWDWQFSQLHEIHGPRVEMQIGDTVWVIDYMKYAGEVAILQMQAQRHVPLPVCVARGMALFLFPKF